MPPSTIAHDRATRRRCLMSWSPLCRAGPLTWAAEPASLRGCFSIRAARLSVLSLTLVWRRSHGQRGFEVDVSAFENWEPGVRQLDVVASVQAWHWVEP